MNISNTSSSSVSLKHSCSGSIGALSKSIVAHWEDDDCGFPNPALAISQPVPGPTPDADTALLVKNKSILVSTSRSIQILSQITPLSFTLFRLGDVHGDVFYVDIVKVYEKQVHWSKKIFSPPLCNAGRDCSDGN